MHQGIQQDDDYDVFNPSSFGVSTRTVLVAFGGRCFLLKIDIESSSAAKVY